jgi:hypothetical protein
VFRHLQNALESFSAKFLCYFDVIQLRLLTLGLCGGDWDKVVENPVKLSSQFLSSVLIVLQANYQPMQNREAVCGGSIPTIS